VSLRLDAEATRLRTQPGSADEDKGAGKDAKELEKKRDLLRVRCRQLGSAKRLRNVLILSGGMASALSTEFDLNPLLLNLRNGTYDLKDFVFRQHRSEDLITKTSHVHYNPDADCPYWELFIADICRDDWDRMMYLKKIAGLMLTGRNDYQYLFFCYGRGANGKSTFFKQLQRIMAEFFIALPIDILLTRNKAASDEYHLARLKGSRVVMASEIPGNRRLNESLIKDLTSNDLLSARNPHEKPFQYEPTHKLFIVGNHKPSVTGMDHGIWRRIRLIPFDYTIPEDKRRPMDEVLAEFRQEESGILNWMIDGYRLLLEEGLEMPEAVRAATEEYQQESDSIGVFLEESTIKGPPLLCVTLKILWAAYNKWCEDNGERPSIINSRQFGITLRERGFMVKVGTGNKTFVYGLELIEGVRAS
jgi:putative DNA primase/helicase